MSEDSVADMTAKFQYDVMATLTKQSEEADAQRRRDVFRAQQQREEERREKIEKQFYGIRLYIHRGMSVVLGAGFDQSVRDAFEIIKVPATSEERVLFVCPKCNSVDVDPHTAVNGVCYSCNATTCGCGKRKQPWRSECDTCDPRPSSPCRHA